MVVLMQPGNATEINHGTTLRGGEANRVSLRPSLPKGEGESYAGRFAPGHHRYVPKSATTLDSSPARILYESIADERQETLEIRRRLRRPRFTRSMGSRQRPP